MSVTEEMLMAYADGEYDPPECTAQRSVIEAAMRVDPELAARVEQFRALRRRVGALHGDVLEEPVPERLIAAVRGASATGSSAGVVDLEHLRRARKASATAAPVRARRRLDPWGALAASLLVGLLVGYFAASQREPGLIGEGAGGLVARSALDRALSSQLAGTDVPTDAVHIGLSFKAKSGDFCRTFVIQGSPALGGLACHHADRWGIEALARADANAAGAAGYRPAGSELPDAIRAVVEAQIAGEPLDSQGEQRARQNHWN